MIHIDQPETDRADALADKLGVVIPPAIGMPMWALPILEAMFEKIELIEERCHDQ